MQSLNWKQKTKLLERNVSRVYTCVSYGINCIDFSLFSGSGIQMNRSFTLSYCTHTQHNLLDIVRSLYTHNLVLIIYFFLLLLLRYFILINIYLIQKKNRISLDYIYSCSTLDSLLSFRSMFNYLLLKCIKIQAKIILKSKE